MRGADLLAGTLAAAGVGRIFSLSGNQIMPVYDACHGAGIGIVHTRHEAASVFMAEAWSQLTGQVGVALVTAAPGAANAMGPLYSARCSETPLLLLTGDSPRAQDGAGAFQELDQVAMSAPLAKLSFRAETPEGLGGDIARALAVAREGRPGPVHLALPFDVVQGNPGGATPPPPAPDPTATPDAVAAIAGALAGAERPLVVCGPVMNATRAGGLAADLAAAVDAPVIVMESPRGLQDPALGAVAQALRQADLVVSLGKRVDFTLGFGAPGSAASWILLDPDADERDRARRNLGGALAQAFEGEPRVMARALIDGGEFRREREAWREHVAVCLAARAADGPAGGRITSAALCAAVQRQVASAPQSVVAIDGGEFGQWAQAGITGAARIINGSSGAIGGALPYGLAAKLARPEATVFALMGDGTVGFHFAEFETAAREGAPFVVVIGNDRRWNAEHLIQLRDYGADRLVGCALSGARYDLAAAALGGHGEYVTRPDDLDAALARAVRSGKVACVNVEIEGPPAPVVGAAEQGEDRCPSSP